jgi:hypothetical protein
MYGGMERLTMSLKKAGGTFGTRMTSLFLQGT